MKRASKGIDKAGTAAKVLVIIPIVILALTVLWSLTCLIIRLVVPRTAPRMPEDTVSNAILLPIVLGLSVDTVITLVLAPIALLVARKALDPDPLKHAAKIELVIAILLGLILWKFIGGIFDLLFHRVRL